MSKYRKKNYGSNVLLKHLNSQLSTNNFSTVKNSSIFGHDRPERITPEHTHLTCCGLSGDECNRYNIFCGWDSHNQLCYAVGENARLDSSCDNDTRCCGQILPGYEFDDNQDDIPPETRSLSDTIGPGNLIPSDGQEFISKKWWKIWNRLRKRYPEF